MGYRDDDINNDRADLAVRRALERLQALDPVAPPPDLVTRAARRLPNVPPAVAARQLARRRAMRLALRLAFGGVFGLCLLLGLASMFGGQGLAGVFGDGGAGVSRVFLTMQLLAKPLWHSLGSGGTALPIAGIAAVAGAGWLWRWMLRRTPIYSMENAP